MNLYLCIFRDPRPPCGGDAAMIVIKKAIIRHSSGEKATKVFSDRLLQLGWKAHETLEIDTTLLLTEGPIGFVLQL